MRYCKHFFSFQLPFIRSFKKKRKRKIWEIQKLKIYVRMTSGSDSSQPNSIKIYRKLQCLHVKLYIDRGVNFSQLHFWDRFYLRELFSGALRKPQKSEKLESAKVDKSATIFWTQKPEGLSHVGRKIFSFSFPCLKNFEKKNVMDWFLGL